MNSNVPLDYALFQLSPKRTRCELIVSGNGKTEKLASGFLKPFTTHLKVAEEQASHGVQSVKLEVEKGKSLVAWFNKGTLERFVRFISTPEVLELVNTFDAELSQLEGARKIYSQGAGDQHFGESGKNSAAAADATKKELLRAIDVRLIAVKQDLATACVRASAAGFRLETVSELLRFAEQFGAFRLGEACKMFLSVCQQRPELISHLHTLPSPASLPQWKGIDDANICSSSGSDMSIDEPEIEENGLDKLKTTKYFGAQLHSQSMSQQQQLVMAESATATSMSSRPYSQHFAGKVEDLASTAASSSEPAQAAGGGSRRLSVQDRINLFESKQKHSVSANLSGGSSSATSIFRLPGAKVEHRRIPSDVSVEKSVLRRWSGASDMSIELNSNSSSNNQKEGGNTTTPTSSVNSLLQTNSRNADIKASGSKEASKSNSLLSSKNRLVAISTFSSSQDQDETSPKGEAWVGDAVCREDAASNSVAPPASTSDKEQGLTWGCTSGSLDGASQSDVGDQVFSQTGPNGFSNSGKVSGLKESAATLTDSKAILEELVKVQTVSRIPSRAALSSAVLAETKNQTSLISQSRDKTEEPDIAVKSQVTSLTKVKEIARKTEDTGIKSNGASFSGNQLKPSIGKVDDISAKGLSLQPQSHENTFNRKKVEATHKAVAAAQVPAKDFSAEAQQASASQGVRFLGKTTGANQMFSGRRDATSPADGSNAPVSQNRKTKEVLQAASLFASLEEPHTVWPTKCNQELNDELQIKADELEKLYAEHKLRIHGDQVASSRRSKTPDVHSDKSVDEIPVQSLTSQVLEKSLLRQGSGNEVESDSNLLLKMVDKIDLSDSKSQKIKNFTPQDDSRGKLYGKYMQIRDDKLREESRSKRVQKEAKMKAMHDSLELRQAELKARFAGYSEGKDMTNAHRRAEKMRSFNSHSTLKNMEQTSESLTEEDEDEQELSESSSSNLSLRLLYSKNLSSSNSRTSVNPTPKQSVKSIISGSFRRPGQSEIPVAHSAPNFSDFKCENTKPSMAVGKVRPHGQPKSYSRNKSSMETEIMKEDRSRRSSSMRKSSSVHGELKDLSSFNTENPNKVFGELKPYIKKGNSVQQSSGRLMMKMKPIIGLEDVKHEEESDELVNHQEDTSNMVKDDEEFQRASTEGNNQVMDLSVDSDNENFRQRQGSGKPESANNDSGIIFPKFNSARTAQYSPEDSSGSWNSQAHHSLVYTQEASDVDASMDSPIDSPASWNLHPLNQLLDTDAARMRKKWESAQIPVISASASHQSRRDVTKGFKRLLKFGWKSRGAEYHVNDLVSASTASEGDDDTEHGRDLVTWPSDDFRKSRMGYSITMNEGIMDGNSFPEQAPRSFFSLSSFRSKASESKLR